MHFYAVVFFLCTVPLFVVADKEWWQHGNFYQIYPRSFMDSNGDGTGDLNGITSRLEYLKEIGITGTWLSPIFKSPMADFGYDISDYTQIHSEFGTMEDFDHLVEKCRRLGIRLILDFVPNHTSDEHEWFKKSAKKDPQYKDYYIWHPGKEVNGETVPPSNWNSVFQGSAWKWSEERGEYYLHQFLKEQPDLNYRNPQVVEEMKNVLRFWLQRGVSGFRIDAVPYLFEVEVDGDGNYPDEPESGLCDDEEGPCFLDHIYTQNLDETFDMIFQFRGVLDDFKEAQGGEQRILMIEAYAPLDQIIRFYGDANTAGAQIPFNFELISNVDGNSNAKDFERYINNWLNAMPNGDYFSNWVLGNHDNKRISGRFGKERTDLINILLQTLPGVAVTYYGEEIAMNDVHLSWEDTKDPAGCQVGEDRYEEYSRDPARTPFQWDSSTNAGFSLGESTWLPVSDDYKEINVQLQKQAPFSHLKVFKTLTSLRKMKTFQDGYLTLRSMDDNILVYERKLQDYDTYIIVLNFSKTKATLDLTTIFAILSEKLEVVVTSIQSGYAAGDTVNPKEVEAYGEVGTVFVTY